MATSNISTLSFTPGAAGILVLEAQYECSGSSSDFGSNVGSRLFVTQNGTTVYGDRSPIPGGGAAMRSSITASFVVSAGLPLTCGLNGLVNGASSATWQNITILATLYKR